METRSISLKTGEWGWFLTPQERKDLTVEQEDFTTISPVIEKIQYGLMDVAYCNNPNNKNDLEWLGATIILELCGVQNPGKMQANEAAEWLRKSGYPYRTKGKQFGVAFIGNLKTTNSNGTAKSFEEIKAEMREKMQKKH